MKDVLSLVRGNIRALTPYSTARDEYDGLADIFLDANESPFNNGYNRYPDPTQRALKKKISALKGVDADRIFIGNGSDEAIDLCFRIFCRPTVDNAIAITPSYGMYKVAAAINDVQMKEVVLNADFSLPVEKLLSTADENTKLIFLCSPNNPTGNCFLKEDILSLLDHFDGIVVVDEAYMDFSDGGSLLHESDGYDHLIVLQTLSKAWGMAGLRAGLAFGAPSIMQLFAHIKYPYNINLATMDIVSKMLDTDISGNVSVIKSERERVAEELSRCAAVEKIYPSEANFLLVRCFDAECLYRKLLAAGIIVRDRSQMTLCAHSLRITIGTPEENDRMLKVIKGEEGEGIVFDGQHKIASFLPCADRTATVERNTRETQITVVVDLEGGSESEIDTGIHFLDHMLDQIVHHSGIALRVVAKGDLCVDEHHTIEDVAIVLGEALKRALGDKRGIERYGFALPMDECEALVLLDFGGRIDFEWDVCFTREYVGDMPTELFRHFFKSLCEAMQGNLHIRAHGENNHHLAESVFKAFARALRMAIRREVFSYELPSSKGVL